MATIKTHPSHRSTTGSHLKIMNQWIIFTFLWTIASSNKIYKNVALQGRATQSTNYETLSTATNVIDGNLDSEYKHGSCFSSKSQPSPWWRVDLLVSHKISHIMITSRGDCCADYLNGAEILIGDSLANNGNNNLRCAQITSIPQGATETFHCFDMKGRYVNVILPGKTGYITFCEIEIYGVPVINDECCACAKICSNNDN
ncbi:fucolectin-like isoform X1 [Lithobates pipiens]